MCQILVFNAINTIVTDMECNVRIDRLPLGRVVWTLGQSAYPDIALHISNYYINIAFPRTRNGYFGIIYPTTIKKHNIHQ
jgi:hypothetical protein